MDISVEETYDLTKIKFNGITHLVFVRSQIIGFQTWKSSALYSIELTFKQGATILVEYDELEKWVTVIQLLEKYLTP